MKETKSEYFTLLKKENVIFLNYLKARFPLFHNSNLFFRDLQYGIKQFFEMKNMKITYPESEKLAIEYGSFLESQDILIRVNDQGWKLNYTDFVTIKPGDPL
jgi:hypothetical protein